MSPSDKKDVIYLDVDDEITSIIDKVRTSHHHIVALVLPKRATMLQSSVNMKLLKRASDTAKKQLVLITAEASLLPLAGAVGLYTAKNLQSKPEIPVAAGLAAPAMDELLTIDETTPADFNPAAAANKPIGDLAAGAAAAAPTITGRYIEPDETMELDNSDGAQTENAAKYGLTPSTAAEAAKQTKTPKSPKNKKLKVPNFLKFRRGLIIGVLILLLIIGGFIAAAIILPHATITLATNSNQVNGTVQADLDPNSQSLSLATGEVPAQVQQTQKTETQQVATTGQKNEGTTATGEVTMTAQECLTQNSNSSYPADVPAGTGISTNGQTYITQNDTSFQPANASNFNSGNCVNFVATSQTQITAQSPGSSYNVSNAPFTVSGRSDVSATGSTSGGTDNVVQVVTQADINNATKQLSSPNATAIQSSLEGQLQQAGLKPLGATFQAGSPKISDGAKVGQQASSVTVTSTTTYYMYGFNQKDLKELVDKNIDGQINTDKQAILDDGLSSAKFTVLSESTTTAQVQVETSATVGPHLNINNLKKQSAGKKSGDVQQILDTNPGVTSVSVHYSPFWVNSVPTNTSKITIKFKKAGSAT